MNEQKYYTINEQIAKAGRGMWSFTDYIMGSETESYKKQVNEAYELGEKAKERTQPTQHEYIDYLCDRYAYKLAEWLNRGYHIECYCPSVMICGAGNFPTRKKEKQNQMEHKHMTTDYEKVTYIIDKIKLIGTASAIIKSNDENVIEMLQDKINTLTENQEEMKAENAYYRKNHTMVGYELLTDIEATEYDNAISQSWYKVPNATFMLTNNNAKIKATQDRLSNITRAKDKGDSEYSTEFCKVIEDTGAMRIKLIFDGKPSDEVRTILKSHGFKWAPSTSTWNRQLTANGKYATKEVIKLIGQL